MDFSRQESFNFGIRQGKGLVFVVQADYKIKIWGVFVGFTAIFTGREQVFVYIEVPVLYIL